MEGQLLMLAAQEAGKLVLLADGLEKAGCHQVSRHCSINVNEQ
jgi:hypothetical protein